MSGLEHAKSPSSHSILQHVVTEQVPSTNTTLKRNMLGNYRQRKQSLPTSTHSLAQIGNSKLTFSCFTIHLVFSCAFSHLVLTNILWRYSHTISFCSGSNYASGSLRNLSKVTLLMSRVVDVVESLSPVWLFCDPMDCSPPASLSIGFPRQEYWSGLTFPSPKILPSQGSNLQLSDCRQNLHYWATR